MTTATVLRPNATITDPSSWTGGTFPHDTTSDNTDTSYATQTPQNPGTPFAKVALTTFTLPAGAVMKTVKVGARMKATQVPPARARATVLGPLGPGGELMTLATVLAQTSSTGFQLYESAPGAWRLTQTDINALEIWFRVEDTDKGSVQFSELYGTLVYVLKPVTNVATVTDPWTASSQPEIAWTNTLDADGGPQTRYEVKVFDEDTFGAGFPGLDPDTDTPYWTSGQVVSGTGSRTVGPLETGDVYRAYVRVAQTVAGTGTHWSAWDYDEFTLTVSPPVVSSVTTVAANATGKITVTVNRNTGQPSWDYVEAQRGPGGVWTDARFATYVDATGNANTFTVDDYEAGNGESVTYRARATRITAGYSVTGSWVASTPALSWTSTSTFLKVPETPADNEIVSFRRAVDTMRPVRRGVFDILGASRPIVVSDTRGASVSQIILAVDTLAAQTEILNILADHDVVLIQAPSTHPFGSKYVSVGHVRSFAVVADTPTPHYDIELGDAYEVDSPPDPTAGR